MIEACINTARCHILGSPSSSSFSSNNSSQAIDVPTAMLGASFLPRRFRTADSHKPTSNPGYINRQITPILQSLSRRACTHPIHTVVFVALLASTTYIGLLEGSLFDNASLTGSASSRTDLVSLVEGARRLRVGEETAWKWQVHSGDIENIDTVSFIDSKVCLQALTYCRLRSTWP